MLYITPTTREASSAWWLFDQADFVTSTVVQYFGVRSLVRFGFTCKFHRDVVSKEVERRRVCISAIEHDATMHLVTQQSWSSSSFIARDSVTVARRIARDSLRLIDDEIDFHHNIYNKYGTGLTILDKSMTYSVKNKRNFFLSLVWGLCLCSTTTFISPTLVKQA